MFSYSSFSDTTVMSRSVLAIPQQAPMGAGEKSHARRIQYAWLPIAGGGLSSGVTPGQSWKVVCHELSSR